MLAVPLFVFVDAISKKNPERNDVVDVTDSVLVTRQTDVTISDSLSMADTVARSRFKDLVLATDNLTVAEAAPDIVNGIDPASLTLNGWWRIPYTATTMPGLTTLGSSGNATMSAGPPAGAALNGFNTPDFDGSGSFALNVAGSNGIISRFNGIGDPNSSPTPLDLSTQFRNNYTAAILVIADTISGASTLGSNNGVLSHITSPLNRVRWGIELKNTPTVSVFHGDSAGTFTGLSTAFATGAWTLIQVRYTFSTQLLEIRTNGNSWVTGSIGPILYPVGTSPVSSQFRIGLNALPLDGRIGEAIVTNLFLSDAILNAYRSYINGRYNLNI